MAELGMVVTSILPALRDGAEGSLVLWLACTTKKRMDKGLE
jgi:hypothetical protein